MITVESVEMHLVILDFRFTIFALSGATSVLRGAQTKRYDFALKP